MPTRKKAYITEGVTLTKTQSIPNEITLNFLNAPSATLTLGLDGNGNPETIEDSGQVLRTNNGEAVHTNNKQVIEIGTN